MGNWLGIVVEYVKRTALSVINEFFITDKAVRFTIMKTAIIIGATGLVGSTLVKQLLDNSVYSKVVLLLRKPLNISHSKLVQEVIDFDKLDASKIVGDDLFCAMGTTLAKAGSKEAQYKIEIGRAHV